MANRKLGRRRILITEKFLRKGIRADESVSFSFNLTTLCDNKNHPAIFLSRLETGTNRVQTVTEFRILVRLLRDRNRRRTCRTPQFVTCGPFHHVYQFCFDVAYGNKLVTGTSVFRAL